MKRFQFRLGHLLGLREQQESLAKLQVGQAARRCDEIRLQISDIQRNQRETGFNGFFDPAALYMRQAYLTRLKLKREQLGKDLVVAEKVRLEQLAIYIAARQHAEVLRKLKTRRLDEHRLDTQRLEDANLDDIVLAKLASDQHKEHAQISANAELARV